MEENQAGEANAGQVHRLHLSSMTGRSHPFLATSLKLSVALSKADSILLICSSSSLSLSIQLQQAVAIQSHNDAKFNRPDQSKSSVTLNSAAQKPLTAKQRIAAQQASNPMHLAYQHCSLLP